MIRQIVSGVLIVYVCSVVIGAYTVHKGIQRRDFDGYSGHKVATAVFHTITGWLLWVVVFKVRDTWRKWFDQMPEWVL